MEELAHRRQAAQARLAATAAEIAPLLPLFERLSLYPAETLLAVPMPAEQAATGALVRGLQQVYAPTTGTAITNSRAIDGAVTQVGAAFEQRMCRSPSLCPARPGQALQGLDVQPQSCKEVAKVVSGLRSGQEARCGLAETR